jgi:hypothetical protein
LYESDNPSPGAVSSREEGAMPTTTHVPVEVYLCSSYEPDAEYVENLQLQRNDSFSHAEKGIVFDMNQLKTLLY